MTGTADYRAALLRRLSQLDSRLHAIESALDAPHSADWEEAAVEREGNEVLEKLGETGDAEIARIRAALERMRKGGYGICTQCGEPISPQRLEVLPETPLCRQCAAGMA